MNERMTLGQIIQMGLLIFAIPFGAGNLIFPTELGKHAGEEWIPAILGFLITDVGLTIFGIIAVALYNGRIEKLTDKVSPYFTWVYVSIIFLFIGPLFAIPRSSQVVYETGIVPFISEAMVNNSFTLPVFSLLFFGLSLVLALNTNKVVEYIGKYLTPILIVCILTLITVAFINPVGNIGEPAEKMKKSAFLEGFLQGYLTMDALGAFIAVAIVVRTFSSYGVRSSKNIALYIIQAGVIAGIGFILVYGGLAYLGATSYSIGTTSNGAEILAKSVYHLLGNGGSYLLMIIIFLACLTTVVGLINAGSQHFHKMMPTIPYTAWAILSTTISFIISNVGLTQLIQVAGPFLTVLYPISIVLYTLAFINKAYSLKRGVFIGSVIGAFIPAVIHLLFTNYNIMIPVITMFIEQIPFANNNMPWIIPAIICGIVGSLFFIEKNDASDISEKIS